MSRQRRTLRVDDLRAKVNAMLATSTCSPAERGAMATVLESVLHDTGNYRGFRYLDATFRDGELISGDESRRAYY